MKALAMRNTRATQRDLTEGKTIYCGSEDDNPSAIELPGAGRSNAGAENGEHLAWLIDRQNDWIDDQRSIESG